MATRTFSSGVVRLLTAGFVDYLGQGLFLAFSAVYFTAVVGLSAGQVGLGLGIAGCLALAGAIPIGTVADRYGAGRTLVVVHLIRAAGTAGYAAVGDWWGFLLAVGLVTSCDQSTAALTQALVADLADEASRVQVLAVLRVLANLAITFSSVVAGLILGSGGATVYRLVLVATAAGYVLVALLLVRMPRGQNRSVTRRPRLSLTALRDRNLLAYAAVDMVLQIWLPLINLGFPLWLAGHSDAGKSWIGVLYAFATLMCVVLMVPATRLARTVPRARLCQAVAGVAIAMACLGFLAAGHARGGWTIALFAVAIGALTLGELTSVSAAWTLSYAVAPDDRRAEYIAAFGMGRSVGRFVLGPILVTGLLDVAGPWTWVVLAVLFTAAGAAALLTPLRVGLRTQVA